VKKPESGLGFGKPKAQNSNPSAKGNQAKKGQGTQVASNGGTKKANPIEAANGNGSALKKSKDAQPPAVEKVPVAQVAKEEEQEEEEASCLICCEPIDYFSVGECEHRFVCSQCTLRRRGLYKEMHCCICKVRPIHSPRRGGSGRRCLTSLSALPIASAARPREDHLLAQQHQALPVAEALGHVLRRDEQVLLRGPGPLRAGAEAVEVCLSRVRQGV